MMTITSNYSEPNNDKHFHENDNYQDLKENTELPNSYNIQEIIDDNLSDKNSISDILKIKPLSENREMILCKKYLRKWKSYVKIKTENMINRQRKQTLNMFLDKISKAKRTVNDTAEPTHKAKVHVRDYNSYQHRYKVQRNIIALQKAKLEQQNKLIEELKYNKIIEASRHSLDTMKEEVRKTYYEIDKHLKPKIKLLTNELNIKEIEEPSLVLQCLKVPQFLQRMEARARKREEKHAIIRERRKQMEEEKIRLKQQAELEKVEMDKEEKLKRMKELKQKRKKEKIENIRKKQHAERLRALTVMADLHYEKSLMLKYGLRPFQLLIQIKQENIEKARAHYKFQLLKNVFLNWMFYTEDMWFERNYKAEEFYRKTILKRTFNALKEHHYEYILKKQVAEDYYDLYVTQITFRRFREYVKIMKEEFTMKWTKAVNYHNCNLLFKTFTCWRTLPALNVLQREQEARKLKWRQKVLQVVPDYKPPDD
ncbi:LOW QUALITY PROTEIN: coiled-coil domain-containing protein 191 [Colias croceus]|uniref:LOW QUALITY PROTEIN: coiled-coil domain-containing protein 191 n=1 Tax=Colias crocea TaxID=72248 RepID=UPI001E27F188|nr:LOW QUALITY PROTEIN: coiled-coil domain-containing protein 191 [Colias croceus]